MSKHTPGPWTWEVNPQQRVCRLNSRGILGGMMIMDFVRWGMNGAAPRFVVNGLMHHAHVFAKAVPGREHDASWYQTLDHPDARLIAAAPELLALCQEALDLLWEFPLANEGRIERFRAAIAKATGE